MIAMPKITLSSKMTPQRILWELWDKVVAFSILTVAVAGMYAGQQVQELRVAVEPFMEAAAAAEEAAQAARDVVESARGVIQDANEVLQTADGVLVSAEQVLDTVDDIVGDAGEEATRIETAVEAVIQIPFLAETAGPCMVALYQHFHTHPRNTPVENVPDACRGFVASQSGQ